MAGAWVWSLADIGKVPHEYLLPGGELDEEKVGNAVQGGLSDLPGVSIWYEPCVMRLSEPEKPPHV